MKAVVDGEGHRRRRERPRAQPTHRLLERAAPGGGGARAAGAPGRPGERNRPGKTRCSSASEVPCQQTMRSASAGQQARELEQPRCARTGVERLLEPRAHPSSQRAGHRPSPARVSRSASSGLLATRGRSGCAGRARASRSAPRVRSLSRRDRPPSRSTLQRCLSSAGHGLPAADARPPARLGLAGAEPGVEEQPRESPLRRRAPGAASPRSGR